MLTDQSELTKQKTESSVFWNPQIKTNNQSKREKSFPLKYNQSIGLASLHLIVYAADVMSELYNVYSCLESKSFKNNTGIQS